MCLWFWVESLSFVHPLCRLRPFGGTSSTWRPIIRQGNVIFLPENSFLVVCLAARWMKVSRNPHTRTRPNQQSREREEKEERSERSANLSSLLFLLPSLPPPSAPVLLTERPHFLFSRSQMLSLLSTSAFFFCFLFFSSIFL